MTNEAATPEKVDEPEVTAEQEQITDETLEALESAGQQAEGDLAAPEGSDDGEPVFELLVPEGAPEEPPPTTLPGRSLDEVQREQEAARAQNYRQVMTDGERLVREQMRGMGVPDEHHEGIWQAVRLLPQAIHRDNEAVNRLMREKAIEQALPEEDFKAFSSQSYEGRKQEIEALVAIGEARANKRWSSALWNQATPEDVRKFHEEAQRKQFDKGRGQGETSQEYASSGQSVNGASRPGRGKGYSQLTTEERSAMSDSERDDWISRYGP